MSKEIKELKARIFKEAIKACKSSQIDAVGKMRILIEALKAII